jgi:hypothetical protein
MKNKEYLIKTYFTALARITQNIVLPENEKKEQLDYYRSSSKNDEMQDYFESLFLSKIMNVLYEYYIDLNSCNSIGNQLYEKSIISSNIHKIMKCFIEDQKLEYYIKENDSDYYYVVSRGGRRIRYRRSRGRGRGREYELKKKFTKNISLLFKYIFKYFDFCLFLSFKEEKSDILKYWITSNNKIFEFYANMKVLLMERNYKKNDYKEIISLISLYSGLINYYNKESIINDKIFKMRINEINKYILTDTYDLSFSYEST